LTDVIITIVLRSFKISVIYKPLSTMNLFLA
jgi:hypothetical protein